MESEQRKNDLVVYLAHDLKTPLTSIIGYLSLLNDEKEISEELREKYNVATAVSGKIALNFLEKRKTDLILLDYVMPDEDGPAVLKKLRENNATKDIPVVFLTGINDRNKIEKVLDMNPQGYLLKPIKPEKLFRTIRQIIG